MTTFPPPPGFTRHEEYRWGYERECTPERAEILQANEDAAKAERLRDEEELRDAWFAMLRAERHPAKPALIINEPAVGYRLSVAD